MKPNRLHKVALHDDNRHGGTSLETVEIETVE